eukprot:scaffold1726_cov260-Pinguiococcus_pyrenoidosus.AAC.21
MKPATESRDRSGSGDWSTAFPESLSSVFCAMGLGALTEQYLVGSSVPAHTSKPGRSFVLVVDNDLLVLTSDAAIQGVVEASEARSTAVRPDLEAKPFERVAGHRRADADKVAMSEEKYYDHEEEEDEEEDEEVEEEEDSWDEDADIQAFGWDDDEEEDYELDTAGFSANLLSSIGETHKAEEKLQEVREQAGDGVWVAPKLTGLQHSEVGEAAAVQVAIRGSPLPCDKKKLQEVRSVMRRFDDEEILKERERGRSPRERSEHREDWRSEEKADLAEGDGGRLQRKSSLRSQELRKQSSVTQHLASDGPYRQRPAALPKQASRARADDLAETRGSSLATQSPQWRRCSRSRARAQRG